MLMIFALIFGFSMLSGCTCHMQVKHDKAVVEKCEACGCLCANCEKCTCKAGECKCKDCPGIVKVKPKKKCCEKHEDEKKVEVLPEPKKVEDCPEKN